MICATLELTKSLTLKAKFFTNKQRKLIKKFFVLFENVTSVSRLNAKWKPIT